MARIFHFSLVSFHDGTTEEQFGPSTEKAKFEKSREHLGIDSRTTGKRLGFLFRFGFSFFLWV